MINIVTKQIVVEKILKGLEVKDKQDIVLLSENLKKMAKKSLDVLLDYVDDEMDVEVTTGKPEKRKKEPKAPFIPEEVLPNKFFGAKTPQEIEEQLFVLPVISERLGNAFHEGEFPSIKRNIGIINVITGNVQSLITKQLWERVDIHEDINDRFIDESEPED